MTLSSICGSRQPRLGTAVPADATTRSASPIQPAICIWHSLANGQMNGTRVARHHSKLIAHSNTLQKSCPSTGLGLRTVTGAVTFTLGPGPPGLELEMWHEKWPRLGLVARGETEPTPSCYAGGSPEGCVQSRVWDRTLTKSKTAATSMGQPFRDGKGQYRRNETNPPFML
ncbi:hypothetical protein FIBSPDRAFT_901608 [Athelia psychrophila]|uniref:Uncharacterized protein n=1 Tax=Athelia psychrophila TaxID=1759441 RepID=A0A165WYM5_9AGAM|nr:hypothetical protein FIBSPDRAFT_901608 [Fibularhizoctonia sp. CBS 109695]